MLPEYVKAGIDEYVDHGHCVGHFLTAVFSNDLFEAVFRADGYSSASLHAICEYIFNFTPASCWGSSTKVKAWMKLHVENPVEAEKIAYADRNARRDY